MHWRQSMQTWRLKIPFSPRIWRHCSDFQLKSSSKFAAMLIYVESKAFPVSLMLKLFVRIVLFWSCFRCLFLGDDSMMSTIEGHEQPTRIITEFTFYLLFQHSCPRKFTEIYLPNWKGRIMALRCTIFLELTGSIKIAGS